MRTSNIFLTVDIVLIRTLSSGKELLLIQRKNDPFRLMWALPGGFVDEGEDLEAAAIRELAEETGIRIPAATQVKAFGRPGRDPRGHTVSIAFYASADATMHAVAADDAAQVQWFPLYSLPELAFDHDEIIETAKKQMGLER